MQNKLTIFLLDNDTSVFDKIIPEINQYFTSHKAYACDIMPFEDIDTMLSAANNTIPDLLITEIDLSDSENGITVSESLLITAPNCNIIYLTSNIQYAMDIFRTNPLYFIIKDHYQEHLPNALNKFISHYQKSHNRLYLHTGNKDFVITINDIIYCEHIGKYVNIFCNDSVYPIRSTLSEFAKLLPSNQFILCHKSFLVNLANIQSVSKSEVIMNTGKAINISRTYRESFRQFHSRWLSEML